MLAEHRRTIADRIHEIEAMTPGRTGNVSVRRDDRVAITPSGVPYRRLEPDDIPVVSLDGEQLWGSLAPSSETPMHRGIYNRFDAGAIVHVHSPWATTLAVLREPVPPVHYMVTLAGDTVPVAEYATYGTEKLAENVVDAMDEYGSEACLLANHGLVACGTDVDNAIETAVAVESVAQVYCQARAIGTPETLSRERLKRTMEQLETYGQDDG